MTNSFTKFGSAIIAVGGAGYAWHLRATSDRQAKLERLPIENKMAANQADLERVVEETAKRVIREWEVSKSEIDPTLVDRLVAQRDKENSIIEHILRNNPEMNPTNIKNYIDSLRMTLRGEEGQNIQLPSYDPTFGFGITNINPISPNVDQGAIIEANDYFISDSASGAATISYRGPSEANPLDFALSMGKARQGFMANSDSSTNIFSYFNISSLSELSSTELGFIFNIGYAIIVIIGVL
jgi:hypothetical protein